MTFCSGLSEKWGEKLGQRLSRGGRLEVPRLIDLLFAGFLATRLKNYSTANDRLNLVNSKFVLAVTISTWM